MEVIKNVVKKNIIIFNLIIIVIFIAIVFNFPSTKEYIIKYIMYSNELLPEYNLKELLSISSTILAVLLGFIATVATVLISMCDKRIMVLVKKFGKTDLIIRSISRSLKSGTIALICIAIIYVNFDFSILPIRLAIMWIMLNCLFIFINESRFLISLVKNIIEQVLFSNENISIK